MSNKQVVWYQNGQVNVATPQGAIIQFGGIQENTAWGKMGEMASAARLRAEGYTFQQQVTIYTQNGTRSVVDFLTRNAAEKLGITESKTANGQLTGPQTQLYEEIAKGNEIYPAGQNAVNFGLEPGVGIKIEPKNVNFDIWDVPPGVDIPIPPGE
jgi:hypothetical protein